MLRSVKYGASAAVLAGAVAATVAFTASAAPAPNTVRLVVDGHARTVTTSDPSVGEVLAGAGYHLDAHDLLAPGASSAVQNGTTIVLKRGRLLHLSIDGRKRDVWTTAPTVAEAMSDLGYARTDLLSVSRSRRLPLTATRIAVRLPKTVTVLHDGQRSQVSTTRTTVSEVLADLGVSLGSYDRISTTIDAPVKEHMVIRVRRVSHELVTRRHVIPFRSHRVDDAHLLSGKTKVVTEGSNGIRRTRWAEIYVDGRLTGRIEMPAVVVRRPVDQVTHVGTKLPPSTVGSAQAIARALMLKDYGWGDDEFSCLDQMWTRESGWRVDAANPSGAYGIPQSLPGSKMAAAGPNWQTNPTTQITWGLSYIKDRYATPCGAWGFWQGHNYY